MPIFLNCKQKISIFIITEKSKKQQKQECQFCKEQKKRPLTAYVKKRNNMQRYDSICEEIEEDEAQDCPSNAVKEANPKKK